MKTGLCSTAIAAVLAFSAQAQAHIAPTPLASCFSYQDILDDTEVFAVQRDNNGRYNTELRYQLRSKGRVVRDELLITDLICEFSTVKGLRSAICFSQTSADKVFIEAERKQSLVYKLVLMANSAQLKEQIVRLGLKITPLGSNQVVVREYSVTNERNTCRFF